MTIPLDAFELITLAELQQARGWQNQFRILSRWGQIISHKEAIRQAENRVQGCEVAVWLIHQRVDEQHYFAFDSDSRIINGLAALVISLCQGQSTQQLRKIDLFESLTQLGIQKHLSPSRSNGLRAVIEKIQRCVN